MSLAVLLKINADGSGARSGLRGTETDLNRVGAAARKAGSDARQGGAGIADAGNKAEQAGNKARSASVAWSGFGAAVKALGIAAIARELVQMADMTTLLDARLRIASNSAEEYANANGLVFDIAQRTRQSLESTATLYTRLTSALKGAGASQAEVARLTETISKGFAVSGASAGEAAAAITQLSQGLASGALRGDEFNSVAEQAPVIMDALAKSLGVTRGELREMAADGQITADTVRKALGDAAGDIDAKFAQIPPTVGGAFTQLTNALQVTVGWFNKAGGASNILVQGIDFVRSAVEKLPGMLLVVRGSFYQWWENIKFGFQALGLQIKIAMATALDAVRIAIAQEVAKIALSLKAADFLPGVGKIVDGLTQTALSLKNSAKQSGLYRRELSDLTRQHRILSDAIEQKTQADVLAFEAERKAIASTIEGAKEAGNGAAADRELAAAKRDVAKAAEELAFRLRQAFREGLAPAQQGTKAASRAMQELTQDIRQVPDFAGNAAQSIQRMNAELRDLPSVAKVASESLYEFMLRGGEFRIELGLADAIRAGWEGGLKGLGEKLREIFKLAKKDLAGAINGAAQFAAFGVDQFRQNPDAPLRAVANIAAQLPGPIGQIAQAVQAIDSIFGGRLLGTNYQVDRTGANLSIGAGGATGNTFTRESRQRSLFRGRAFRNTTTALDANAQRALDDFFRSLQNAVAQAARALSVEAAAVVQGTFREVRDKNGNITEQFSTVNGRRFNEDQTAFQQRVTAESLIATIANSAAEASAVAERWRANAAQLLEGAQLMLIAQGEIVQGVSVLNTGAGLAGVVDLVEDLAAPGESLVDAYTRISGATRLLDEALRLSNVTLDRTREEVIAFAAGIAEAAGGLDQAAGLWQDYFDRFYTAQERAQASLDAATASRDEQLAGLGLDSNISLTQFRQLFEERLPTLSAEAVVQWLRAARAIGLVIDAEEALAETRTDIAEAVRDAAGIEQLLADLEFDDALAGMTSLEQAVARLTRQFDDYIAAAIEMGATEEEIARIRALGQRAIDRLTQAEEDRYDMIADSIRREQDYLRELAASIRDAFGWVREALNEEQFSATSTLTPQQRFEEAQAQFQQLLVRARGGDLDAARELQAAYERLLEEGLSYLGGGDQYRALREAARASLEPLMLLGEASNATMQDVLNRLTQALLRFTAYLDGQGGTGPVSNVTFGPPANSAFFASQVVPILGGSGDPGAQPSGDSAKFAAGGLDETNRRLGEVVGRLERVEKAMATAGDKVAESITRSGFSKARFG